MSGRLFAGGSALCNECMPFITSNKLKTRLQQNCEAWKIRKPGKLR